MRSPPRSSEFEALFPHLPAELANRWYKPDENIVCPRSDGTGPDKGVYVLQSRTGAGSWAEEVEGPLGDAFRRAARAVGLPEAARCAVGRYGHEKHGQYNVPVGTNWNLKFFFFGSVVLSVLAGCRRSKGTGEYAGTINEQLLLLATIIGAIAALPALIEYLVERRKRRERLALSLDDVRVGTLQAQVAGLEQLLEDIADLIDRAHHPADYASVQAGNEILIVGANLSGKKALAKVIAQRAKIDRLITVYNPRNTDALAKARSLITKYRTARVMLLLAGLDTAFTQDDDEIMAELDALVETTSASPNVLVIGTALRLEPNSPLDNAFGVKLVLPGTPRMVAARAEASGPVAEELRQFLTTVIHHYLAEADRAGSTLRELTSESFTQRLLEVVGNPAEVQDIMALCQTTAIYRHKRLNAPGLEITPEILEVAIRRVVTGTVEACGSMASAG